MFRSLMTIIRGVYLYLTKVIFMLKHSVKLRRFIYIYIRRCGILYVSVFNGHHQGVLSVPNKS